MEFSRRKKVSIRTLLLKNKREIRKIINLFYQVGLERGEASAKKVFQVLERWQKKGWILSWGEHPRWGYHDYILHQDGWFMTLDGEMVDFQIKSSQKAAQIHLEEYPDIRVIIVNLEMSIDELSEKMRELFKDNLPAGFQGKPTGLAK